MTATTTGAELYRFHDDEDFWPNHLNVSCDGGDVTVNGKLVTSDDEFYSIPHDAVVKIKGGIVNHPELKGRPPSYETYFRRWRDAQTRQSFQVDCDTSMLDAVLAAVRAAGGQVTR